MTREEATPGSVVVRIRANGTRLDDSLHRLGEVEAVFGEWCFCETLRGRRMPTLALSRIRLATLEERGEGGSNGRRREALQNAGYSPSGEEK